MAILWRFVVFRKRWSSSKRTRHEHQRFLNRFWWCGVCPSNFLLLQSMDSFPSKRPVSLIASLSVVSWWGSATNYSARRGQTTGGLCYDDWRTVGIRFQEENTTPHCTAAMQIWGMLPNRYHLQNKSHFLFLTGELQTEASSCYPFPRRGLGCICLRLYRLIQIGSWALYERTF